ncbi:MAG TPA: histidine kinase N-terminal 7TM domain-containing protein [Bacillota bacterium]|nr:histidine kinase N-terminal 7TM domain-containing protein [Bacillota bacterium]
MIIPPYILPTLLVLTTVIMFLVFAGTYITAKAQKTPALWSFIWMLGSMLLWLVGRFMAPVAPEESYDVVCVLIQLSGIFLLPGGWFLFCHSLDRESWPQKWLLSLWLLLNGALQTLIFTNSWRLLFIGEIVKGGFKPSPLFPVMSIGLANLEFLGGLVYLFRYRRRRRRREKAVLLLALNLFFIFSEFVITYWDASRFISDIYLGLNLILFSGLMLYLGKYVFVDVSPISLDVFLNNIQDAVLVFDSKDLLVDSNLKTLGQTLSMEGISNLSTFIARITTLMVEGAIAKIQRIDSNLNETIYEYIALKNVDALQAQIEYFILCASVLYDAKNKKIGFVITMHDITSDRLLAEDLARKNTELERINDQLQDNLSIANRLEEEKERNRIAAEIQQQIGQNISELINNLEDSRACVRRSTKDMNADTKILKLNLAIDKCREALGQIRKAVNKLMPK